MLLQMAEGDLRLVASGEFGEASISFVRVGSALTKELTAIAGIPVSPRNTAWKRVVHALTWCGMSCENNFIYFSIAHPKMGEQCWQATSARSGPALCVDYE
jgi:hypothetical protein